MELRHTHSALFAILRSVVGFALRRACSYQELSELLKAAYVEVASEEMQCAGHKVNPSRLSVRTGINRQEVKRLLEGRHTERGEKVNPLTRVIAYWENDPEFRSQSGKPRVLKTKGENSEFSKLVRRVSRELSVGTVLGELVRLELAEKTNTGVRLLQGEQLMLEKGGGPQFELLATEIDTLMTAVEENVERIDQEQEPVNLHLRTTYNNIFISDLPTVRQWVRAEGKRFHKKIRDYLSRHDKDIVPDREHEPAGGTVSVTAFSLIENDEA